MNGVNLSLQCDLSNTLSPIWLPHSVDEFVLDASLKSERIVVSSGESNNEKARNGTV